MATLGFWSIAEREPDRLAVIDADHVSYPYRELAARAHQVVHGLRSLGLGTGDVVATLLPNVVDTVVLMLATSEAGLYLAPVNYHLVGEEVAYIVEDSGARAFVAHQRFAAAASAVPAAGGLARLSVGSGPDQRSGSRPGGLDGFSPFEEMVRAQPPTRPDGRTAGGLMNYTSGTTGRPKGVKRALSGLDPDAAAEAGSFLLMLFGIEALGAGRHLVTAPLYHTAVAQYMTASLHGGHAAVLMDQWTPQGTLERIARHRVTTTHMVPTMFHRLLELPAAERAAADLSSLTHVIHSAAPCPVATKRAMLDWWGPVIYEYYAATEGGGTLATPEDWEKKPGTVGRPWPISEVVVLDDAGSPLPPGQVGTVWMRMGDHRFSYHKDPDKTRQSWRDGYFTVGDAGYLDEDGYLFLSDRKADMIISGGVNIYPAEIEAVLIAHPDVADVAVFGIPDDDWGEQVKAAVQPAPGTATDAAQAARLTDYAREHLAGYKVPRSVDFVTDFPRDPNGKVYKRQLRDPYWAGRDRQI